MGGEQAARGCRVGASRPCVDRPVDTRGSVTAADTQPADDRSLFRDVQTRLS